MESLYLLGRGHFIDDFHLVNIHIFLKKVCIIADCRKKFFLCVIMMVIKKFSKKEKEVHPSLY